MTSGVPLEWECQLEHAHAHPARQMLQCWGTLRQRGLTLSLLQFSRASDGEETYSVKFCARGKLSDEGWYTFSCCS